MAVEHPEYDSFRTRLAKLRSWVAPFRGHAFRMVQPEFYQDHDIVSGIGGVRSSGRWNLKGSFRCSYMSRSPETALEEVLAASRRKNLPDAAALPRILTCVVLDLTHVLDLTDGRVRRRCRVSQQRMIEECWWRENFHAREALTQALGRAANDAGFEGIIVPSAAQPVGGTNVVVFIDNLLACSAVQVVTPIRWS